MPSNKKVVQTQLTKDEYDLFVEAVSKKGMSLQEGLRKAALAVVTSNFEVDPKDPFFKARSSRGKRDLSANHDRYLYGLKGSRDRKQPRRTKID
jgi:hypothetical protein